MRRGEKRTSVGDIVDTMEVWEHGSSMGSQDTHHHSAIGDPVVWAPSLVTFKFSFPIYMLQ